jgi:hypothetical protein
MQELKELDMTKFIALLSVISEFTEENGVDILDVSFSDEA